MGRHTWSSCRLIQLLLPMEPEPCALPWGRLRSRPPLHAGSTVRTAATLAWSGDTGSLRSTSLHLGHSFPGSGRKTGAVQPSSPGLQVHTCGTHAHPPQGMASAPLFKPGPAPDGAVLELKAREGPPRSRSTLTQNLQSRTPSFSPLGLCFLAAERNLPELSRGGEHSVDLNLSSSS